MRNIYTLVIALLLTVNSWAQAPQKMSYQAVVRNSSNALVTSTPVGMKISILQGSSTGSVVYSETQTPNTNANGLVSLELGNGTVVTGTFSAINWANGPYFIKTETDPTGGTAYTISGTSELLSVPYALHAKTAESITGGITETDPVFAASPANGISTTDISNWNNKLSTEVDGSITNELQTLSISNDTVYLSNGGYAKLPAGFDGNYNNLTNKPTNVSAFTNDAGYLTSFTEVDGSITNELQTLSIGNDTIYLSNGGYTKLPAGFDGNYNNLTNKPTNVSAFTNDAGYLTSFTEVDGSITNELQTLRISNDTIYLSNGGFAKLPATNAWSLNGNAGTINGTNFIGTTDNVPLNFKVNNEPAGRIEPSLYNTFFGYQSGKTNTSGIFNTGVGEGTIFNNTTGNYNTAFGGYSLYNNTTGSHNTAIGKATLLTNTTGHENTSVGLQSMYNNTTGYLNTAVGYDALLQNTIGNNNVALGVQSGRNNVSGSNNVFLGYQAGYNETSSNKLYIANSSTNPPLIYGDFSLSKIGIGIITPSKELTIKGDAQIQTKGTWTAGAKARLYLGEDDNIWIEHIHSLGLNLNTASGWKMTFMDGTDENMRIDGNGNVGIGTTTASEKLVVVGNIGSGQIATFDCQTCDDRLITLGQVSTDNGGYVKYKKSSNYTGIGVHGHSEQLIVNSAGNVGVGTTSPTAKLQVETYGFSNKTIWGMNSMLIQNQTPGSRTLLALAPNGTQNADFVIFHNSDYTTNYESLYFGYENTLNHFNIGTSKGGTGTVRRLVLDATGAGTNLWKQLVLATNGNVGIGTLTPSAALEVNGAIKVTGGTASQFLKADGSVDANTYLTAIVEVADEFSATAAQTSFTLTQTPSTNSKVKMYINGVRISNTAYSVSGTTLTYVPANNGSYVLSASDRIQFDYSY